MVEIVGTKKSIHTRFTVLSAILGVHYLPNGDRRNECPKRGDIITREELEAVGIDVERLVGLKAVAPIILTIDQLPDPDPAVKPAPVPAKDDITSRAKNSGVR